MVEPDGRSLTYRDLDRRSDEVASGLARRGVREGDVVVLRLPSQTPYLIAYAAAAKLGAITAGVNPRLAPPEQAAVVELVDPRVELTDPGEVDALGAEGRGAVPNRVAPDPERPVVVVFTSGTTGVPKGAVFCERQLAAVTRIDVGDEWADRGGSPMLASTAFAHIGFMTKLPWYLRRGTTTHTLERWRAADALRLIAEHRMPSIGGIAPQVALLLRVPQFDDYDLAAVETIVMGGAASPPALVEEARRRFDAAYSIRYSSTESGGCGTGTAFDADDDEALYSVGRPRGGIQVAIRDEEGRDVVGDEPGEIWLRSPTSMSGYWQDPDATRDALVDGWLRTGDLGRVDERGLLRLAGRAKEMFIRGGYNVYPVEVEAQLASHPAIAECAVVPRPDEVLGEIGVAVIVARPGMPAPSLTDVRDHLAGRLADYKAPEALRIVPALPYTPMHKIDRRALAATEAAAKEPGAT